MDKYEELVIQPILDVIEKHQNFLCKPENLGQLSKLGFMFDVFYSAGRYAFGYEGKIEKRHSCDNNPKYEIGDGIEYNNIQNENFVYDAWGMHVSNEMNSIPFNEIKKLILEGRELSKFEKQYRSPNKTFDEWAEVLSHPEYEYNSMFTDRKSVANHLLCVIGNGFGYNKEAGYVYTKASGADQDQDGYGDWENSKFPVAIQKIVNKILINPELELAINIQSKFVLDFNKKKETKEIQQDKRRYKHLLPAINEVLAERGEDPLTVNHQRFIDIVAKYKNEQFKELYSGEKIEYYPISKDYSIITKFDENTHPSYIKAGLEICNELAGFPPELKEGANKYQNDSRNYMIEFAINFIRKFG